MSMQLCRQMHDLVEWSLVCIASMIDWPKARSSSSTVSERNEDVRTWLDALFFEKRSLVVLLRQKFLAYTRNSKKTRSRNMLQIMMSTQVAISTTALL